MLNRRSFCFGALTLPIVASAAPLLTPVESSLVTEPLVWSKLRKIRIVLNDLLGHPFYWWPRTLLSYPIAFQVPADLDRLQVTHTDTGERIPIQFSDVAHDQAGVHSATLHFFSDLPSGGRREFVLTTADRPVANAAGVREEHEGDTIVLDTGLMRVRIPATQKVSGDAPGPIMQVSRGGPWIGASTLNLSGDPVKQITTNRVAGGPLFVAYEVAYETEGGSRYVATIQCNSGFDFVYLREDMDGLRPGARGMVETTWTGFDVTHRQTPNHPFPVPDRIRSYEDYAWERIDEPWPTRDVRFGSSRPVYPEVLPEGELPVVLGVYQASTASSVGTSATFWARHSGDALGIFIDKVAAWRDHEYAYEVESATLELRFNYRDGRFSWRWPLARGCRSTCITFYDHEKDKQAQRQLEQDTQGVRQDGLTYKVLLNFTSYPMFLQNRYGTLDLNCVKDWVLEYPAGARRPSDIFPEATVAGPEELERSILADNYVCTLPVTGTREDGGFNPVRARHILDWWIADFNCMRAGMTERQRARLTAMFLFIAYVHAGDDFMPLIPMLSGHPNFLADVKGVPPAMSFLFPEHPKAQSWVDMWEKCVALVTRYNTRPPVKPWDADGGRWTENLGTYVWAFLRPSLRTDFLVRNFDGIERFATPQLAEMANWLVNTLSAPFLGETEDAFHALQTLDYGHEWGALAPGKGPFRVFPPQGAHSERRIPPRSLWYLGTCLERYAPLSAEHAMWAALPTSQDMETPPQPPPPWRDIMYRVPDNRGTNPHLRSRKHTGYGVVLRSAVGSPEEVSIHLEQIDQGPNYRWGWAGEGGCGVLYFFAAGKAYSFNGSEDVGDRRDHDTDFCTNFGVFIDGEFRSVGQNVLSQPLYDLGAGQFAEIVPRQGADAYSAPEYASRSILLAGHDYFVLYDAVMNQSIAHRLSWFVRRGSELPFIQLVRGADPKVRETQRTDIQTAATTGVWFDGVGDSMAVVSHRRDLQVEATDFGCRVHSDAIDDLIFRNPQPIRFSDATASFDGTSGLIRRKKDGWEFAMFHGTKIGVSQIGASQPGASGITLSTTDTDLGISCSLITGQPPRGEYYALNASSVTITLPSIPAGARFYIDGEPQTESSASSALVINLKAGHHQWELTDTLPVPIAPSILRTENRAGGARVVVASVAAATSYRLELSKDNGVTWSNVASQSEPAIEVSGLTNGEKVHVRAVALNSIHESLPGPEYPLYVTSDPPPPPDGLQCELRTGSATISWGEVLGVTEYRLSARLAGKNEFRLLYRGMERSFEDRRSGIQSSNAFPETSAAAAADLIEYCVTAVNGNGEGARSRMADTNPASWRNWDPRPGEGFRRVYAFPPDSPPSPGSPPRYYPR
ncbi:MAG: hypothetical protein ABSD13_17335 [Candidatus Korobacteraceae bacterium]|jgi:hypothetical protein